MAPPSVPSHDLGGSLILAAVTEKSLPESTALDGLELFVEEAWNSADGKRQPCEIGPDDGTFWEEDTLSTSVKNR